MSKRGMDVWIGVDGGGSKTAYMLGDINGNVLEQCCGESISYREHGLEAVARRAGDAVKELLSRGSYRPLGMCLGLPAYGESAEMDARLELALSERFAAIPLTLVNDAVVSWAGALGCEPGISVVAGTGSIAFGRDAEGREARCGGWSERFSDEGSCYWIAMRGVNLYTKQADGRELKGALYDIMRRELSITRDDQFVYAIEHDYLPHRKKVAELQRVVLEAARAGDDTAAALYTEAAWELARLADGAARGLELPRPYTVSLTGGLLNAGGLLLSPLCQAIGKAGGKYQPARFAPVYGALLLAIRAWKGM